jgi:hypothetical protein
MKEEHEKRCARIRAFLHEIDIETPQDLVDAARDPACPIHDRFDWDNTDAAKESRLAEAEGLVMVFGPQARHIAWENNKSSRPPARARTGAAFRETPNGREGVIALAKATLDCMKTLKEVDRKRYERARRRMRARGGGGKHEDTPSYITPAEREVVERTNGITWTPKDLHFLSARLSALADVAGLLCAAAVFVEILADSLAALQGKPPAVKRPQKPNGEFLSKAPGDTITAQARGRA